MIRNSSFAFVLVLAALGVAGIAQAADTAEYSALDAAKHVGETATVTDKVEDAYQAKGGNIFLNLAGKHPNEVFTVFVPASAASEFKDVKMYDGKTISVTGKISEHNGKPEISVKSPSDITIKGEGASPAASASASASASPTATP
jgi:DNA/RNA endonuclease YhcR with UshA esterase domain